MHTKYTENENRGHFIIGLNGKLSRAVQNVQFFSKYIKKKYLFVSLQVLGENSEIAYC